MSKVLAVFGATGVQGKSVVNFVLNDPELSKEYKIRAITRDVNSDKATQLKAQVEVVPGDVSDRASIEKALTGVHTVFLITVPAWDGDAIQIEYNAAKLVADVAVEKGVDYIIFSTLPSVRDISGGKYTHVSPFDAKAMAEKYIRSLPIKSAFCAFGFFMQNLVTQPFLAPQPAEDGTWVMYRPMPSSSKIPYIDAERDVGTFVGAILAKPAKYEGKTFCASAKIYTLDEVVNALAKHTGKRVIFKQISYEEFKESMPFAQDLWDDGMHYWDEYGYYGPGSDELVAWACENARGKLTTLEEYLEANPYKLL